MANEIGITSEIVRKEARRREIEGKTGMGIAGWEIITRTLYKTEKGSVEGEMKNV